MGQSKPFRSTALVVEDDPAQREIICTLLQETDFDVIQCESGEAAELVLQQNGSCISLLLTNVELAGCMDGLELAQIAKERTPDIEIIVTSGKPLVRQLPNGVRFWAKPWAPLDMLRTAEQIASHRPR
jgi:CheY-like chemotaxis protein